MRKGEPTQRRSRGFPADSVAHRPLKEAQSALAPAKFISVSAAALSHKVVVGVLVHTLTAKPMTRLLLTQSAAVSRYLVVSLESLAYAHPRASLALLATERDCSFALDAEAFWRVAEPVSCDALAVTPDAILGEIGVRVVEELVARCCLNFLMYFTSTKTITMQLATLMK